MALRKKHLAFIAAYTKKGSETFGCASKSAREAGYSQKSSGSSGAGLLKNPEIQKAISEIEAGRERDLEKAANISKEALTALCLSSMEAVPAGHPNRPRYIDLAAKLRGFFSDGVQMAVMVQHNENEPPLKSRVQNLYRKVKQPKPQSTDT